MEFCNRVRHGPVLKLSTFSPGSEFSPRSLGTILMGSDRHYAEEAPAYKIAVRRPIRGRAAMGAAIRAVRTCLAAVLITAAALMGAYAAQAGSSSQASAADTEEPPAQVRALLNLLADTTVQKWLEQQGAAKAAAAPAQETDNSVED